VLQLFDLLLSPGLTKFCRQRAVQLFGDGSHCRVLEQPVLGLLKNFRSARAVCFYCDVLLRTCMVEAALPSETTAQSAST